MAGKKSSDFVFFHYGGIDMKLIKISIADIFFMKIWDLFRLFYDKKAIVESYLYPKQISDRMEWDKFVETDINHYIMLKSSYDKNWYTIDPNNSKNGLLKADNELADFLDIIDYRVRQMSQVNIVNAK